MSTDGNVARDLETAISNVMEGAPPDSLPILVAWLSMAKRAAAEIDDLRARVTPRMAEHLRQASSLHAPWCALEPTHGGQCQPAPVGEEAGG